MAWRASRAAGGPGAIVKWVLPSLRANRPGAPSPPKKKSGKSSLFTSPAATARAARTGARPTSPATSLNVPSRPLRKSWGGPSGPARRRSTSRRSSKSVGTTARAAMAAPPTPAPAETSLKCAAPSFWNRRCRAPAPAGPVDVREGEAARRRGDGHGRRRPRRARHPAIGGVDELVGRCGGLHELRLRARGGQGLGVAPLLGVVVGEERRVSALLQRAEA